jgi:hypothetical protein
MKSYKTKSQRNHHSHTVKKAKSIGAPNIALLVVLGIIVILLGFVVVSGVDIKNFFVSMDSTEDETETVMTSGTTPRPSPRPLTQGKEVFTYSPGPLAIGPKISEFTMDPMDSKIGQRQTITVKLNYTSPVTSVTATLETDNKKAGLIFTRIDGTESNGTWQATRTEDDTHDYTYYLDFTLVGTPDTYRGGFAFR